MSHDDQPHEGGDASPQPALLTIGQAAQAAGITPHTLRYYERVGLFTVPRAHSGQRRYGPAELLAVEFIHRLRGTGMPIRQIKAYADAARTGQGVTAGLSILQNHRQNLVADLAERQLHLEAIDRKINHYQHATRRTHAVTPVCQENS